MFKYADRVQETSTTTGTGTLNLDGASIGYQTFVAGIGTTNTCYYCIVDSTDAWEVGLGTVTSGTPDTLARSVIVSSNSDALINCSASSTVFCTVAAERFILNKNDATIAPTTSNDNTEGYSIGSRWNDVTNDIVYFCLDASTGAAIWQAVGSGGGSGGGDDVIGYENVVATTGGGAGNYTISTNFNMVTAGTLTITAGDTITVPTGSTWTIV